MCDIVFSLLIVTVYRPVCIDIGYLALRDGNKTSFVPFRSTGMLLVFLLDVSFSFVVDFGSLSFNAVVGAMDDPDEKAALDPLTFGCTTTSCFSTIIVLFFLVLFEKEADAVGTGVGTKFFGSLLLKKKKINETSE